MAGKLLGGAMQKKVAEYESASARKKRLALAAFLGVPQPAQISIEDPSGGPAETRTVERAMTPEQRQTQSLIDSMSPEEAMMARAQIIEQKIKSLAPQSPNYDFTEVDGKLLRTDSRAGTAEPIYEAPRKPHQPNIGPVDPENWLPESVQSYAETGDYRVLQPRPTEGANLQERLSTESGLRKELNSLSAGFREIDQRMQIIQKGVQNPTAVDDIAVVFAFLKLLDPASTAREGEVATAEQARGVPGDVLNLYNRIVQGQRLTQEQRGEFFNSAANIYRTKAAEQEQLRRQYADIATRAGVDVQNVVLDAFKPRELAALTSGDAAADLPGFNELTPEEQAELRHLIEARRARR
jgi:hypothetical protein